MREDITLKEAVQILDDIVTEVGPDYTYPYYESPTGCNYIMQNKPACIVGVALSKLGASVEELEQWDYSSEFGTSDSFDIIARSELPNINDDVVELFSTAQQYQDINYTWKDAVSLAKEAIIK